MKVQTANLKLRLQALFNDYLSILGYLLVLALVIAAIYVFILEGIPETTEAQSHWIAFLTTTLPVTLYFSWCEGRAPYASFGKKRVGLKIEYTRQPLLSSVIRNILKFLPWHLGYHAVIKGLFSNDFSVKETIIKARDYHVFKHGTPRAFVYNGVMGLYFSRFIL